MYRRRVGLIFAMDLMLVVLSAWAGVDQRKHPTDDFPSEVASVWFDQLYDVIKSEATAPPPASRIYGIAAVALYEAVVPGARHHRSLVGQLNGLAGVPQPKKHKKYHWPTVANAALARTIRDLFPSLKPENLDIINALEQRFAAQFHAVVPPSAYERSVAHGQAVAGRRPVSTPTRCSPVGARFGRWSSPRESRARPRALPPLTPTLSPSSMRPRSTSTPPGCTSRTNSRPSPTTGPTAPARPARPRGTGWPSSASWRATMATTMACP